MNEIELQLRARHYKNDPLGYLVVEAQVDNEPIADFEACAIDLQQYQRSLENDGEFFIITCWCGDPSCANIEHGISVQHTADRILWQATIDGQPRTFEFDREAYTAAQTNLQSQAQELLAYLKMANDGELTIVPIRNRKFFNN